MLSVVRWAGSHAACFWIALYSHSATNTVCMNTLRFFFFKLSDYPREHIKRSFVYVINAWFSPYKIFAADNYSYLNASCESCFRSCIGPVLLRYQFDVKHLFGWRVHSIGYLDNANGLNIGQKCLRKNGTSLHSPENIFKELRWMELWHIYACFQECYKNWAEG